MRFFGCHRDSLADVEQQGMLPTIYVPYGVAGAHCSRGEFRVRESEVERFIREYPWAYDPSAMFPRMHRLARIARSVHQRNPWWTLTESAQVLEINRRVLYRWVKRGLVAHKRRFLAAGGGQGGGVMVFQASDLRGLSEEIQRCQREAAAGRTQTLLAFQSTQRAA
jgi:hypothetical protein